MIHRNPLRFLYFSNLENGREISRHRAATVNLQEAQEFRLNNHPTVADGRDRCRHRWQFLTQPLALIGKIGRHRWKIAKSTKSAVGYEQLKRWRNGGGYARHRCNPLRLLTINGGERVSRPLELSY